jgi:hypothetical protein
VLLIDETEKLPVELQRVLLQPLRRGARDRPLRRACWRPSAMAPARTLPGGICQALTR